MRRQEISLTRKVVLSQLFVRPEIIMIESNCNHDWTVRVRNSARQRDVALIRDHDKVSKNSAAWLRKAAWSDLSIRFQVE